MTAITPQGGRTRRRRWPLHWLPTTAIVVVLLVGVLALLKWPGYGLLEPKANACSPAVAIQPGPGVGLATGDVFDGATPAELNAYMGTSARVGFWEDRTDAKVSEALTPNGSYDWSHFCDIARAAGAQGQTIRAILDDFPSALMKSPQAMGDMCHNFATTAADSNVAAVEFDNEPNAQPPFKPKVAGPKLFMSLYGPCYDAIEQVAQDTGWHVMVEPGGTAAVGTTDHNGDGWTAPDWYTALYAVPGQNGLAQHSCNTAVHPYDTPRTVTNSDPNWAQITQVWNLMAKHGKGHCRVDITEMGWPTNGGTMRPTNDRNPTWKPDQPVTALRQGTFFNDALGHWLELWKQGKAGVFDVYSLIEQGPDPKSVERYFGIYQALHPRNPYIAGTAKPAAYVISRFIADHLN